MLKVMSRKLVRKALDMIKKMAEEEVGEDSEDEETEGSHEEEVKDKESKEDKKSEEEEKGEESEKLTQERRDRYKAFWKEFGKNIKLGIIEDSSNRNKLAKLTRWYSSFN